MPAMRQPSCPIFDKNASERTRTGAWIFFRHRDPVHGSTSIAADCLYQVGNLALESNSIVSPRQEGIRRKRKTPICDLGSPRIVRSVVAYASRKQRDTQIQPMSGSDDLPSRDDKCSLKPAIFDASVDC